MKMSLCSAIVLAQATTPQNSSGRGTALATWADLVTATATNGTYTLAPDFSMEGFSDGPPCDPDSDYPCRAINLTKVDVTVVGQGAVLDAGKNGSFFYIASSASLTLKNMTLQNGGWIDATWNGGAVWNGGTFQADSCKFFNNVNGAGGAVFNQGPSQSPNPEFMFNVGVFMANDCNFSSNANSPGSGGAVYNSGGSFTARGCGFFDNVAAASDYFVKLCPTKLQGPP